MITSNNFVKFNEDSFQAYNSPSIVIKGQSSNKLQDGYVTLDLDVYSSDLSIIKSETVTIPINSIISLATNSNISGVDFITNLYTVLEQLLDSYLSTLNPDCTFNIVN